MKYLENMGKSWSVIKMALSGEEEHWRRELRQRSEDMSSKYDRPPTPQKTMSRKKCVVGICHAISCKHNKHKQCMLRQVTISDKAVCVNFEKGKHERGYE